MFSTDGLVTNYYLYDRLAKKNIINLYVHK